MEKLQWKKCLFSDKDYLVRYGKWKFVVEFQKYGIVGYKVRVINRMFDKNAYFNCIYISSEKAKKAVKNFINTYCAFNEETVDKKKKISGQIKSNQ